MKKRGGFKKIIIIIAVILVLGAVFGNRDEKKGSSANTKPTNTVSQSNSQNSGRIGGSGNSDYSGSSGSTKQENTTQNQPEKTPQSQPADTKDQNYISPELKAFLESYEAFMDEYCEFMDNYDSNDLTMLTKYLSLVQKANDFSAKADKYDSSTMTDAESIYYLETMNRIEIKLLKASQSMQK